MSYDQKSHTCLHCRGRASRRVDYYALMGGYYHYECWLELGRERVHDASTRHAPVNPVPSPASDRNQVHPQLDLFTE